MDKEKAKAYDNIIEKANKMHNENCDACKACVEELIPELKESEDERIRKEIKEFLDICLNVRPQIIEEPQYLKFTNWLEKQGEPTDINPSEYDSRLNKLLKQFETLPKKELESILSFYLNVVQEGKQGKQNQKHFELKAGHWYICHRAFCCRADHLTVKEGERFMCEKDGIVKGFVIKEPEKYFKEVCAPAPIEDEQKPPIEMKSAEESLGIDSETWNKVVDESIYGEQKPAMIQWKGNNLKEVIDFTGIYKDGFEKWFNNSWEEYEKYVHEHNNIFKIFNKDGSHIEVPIGAWIVKTPDGYNTASRYVFRQKPAWNEEDENIFRDIVAKLHSHPNVDKTEYDKSYHWLKYLRPQKQQEWDKHDIEMIDWLIRCCEKEHEELCNDRYGHQDIVSDLKRDCRKKWDWLESLKDKVVPQKQWRPSDEQMEALANALSLAKSCGEESAFDLRTLYEQLTKLKEG